MGGTLEVRVRLRQSDRCLAGQICWEGEVPRTCGGDVVLRALSPSQGLVGMESLCEDGVMPLSGERELDG